VQAEVGRVRQHDQGLQERRFGTVEQLEESVGCMSEHAKRKADEKIKLLERIELLKRQDAQTQLFG
jgi:hypothetical protein